MNTNLNGFDCNIHREETLYNCNEIFWIDSSFYDFKMFMINFELLQRIFLS